MDAIAQDLFAERREVMDLGEQYVVQHDCNEITFKYCPKCGAICRRDQKGRDDECPECGECIEWT